MNIKNAVYKDNERVLVDVEIEHPQVGWIPYTFKSDESDESFDAEIREYLKTASIGSFVPTIIPLESVKRGRVQVVEDAFNTTVSQISTALPHEMVSWEKQEAAAREYLNDTTGITPPILTALVTSRGFGESEEVLAGKIVANADAYMSVYYPLLGKFQNLSKEIDDATTAAAVNAIEW